MKIAELRQRNKADLEKLMADDKEKLRQLRFDLAAGKVKNVKDVQKTRKEIARIMTLIKAL
ncbi:MAG: 50S ribosomal protein L29 [Candidatus Paceibacterota bacterium]|jgi:large subunit ribosomal protein L29